MVPRKLKVGIAFFSYGGNGGIASEHPDIRTWYAQTILECYKDERIESSVEIELADTPITMTRNQAVLKARATKCDVLVMVDSDQKPDMHLGHMGAKPFFKSSFDFIYDNYDKGPHVVGAPYCGPPPDELVYVFRWERGSSKPVVDNDARCGKYTRSEAAIMAGIQPCGGLPTGLIMFDMRIFDVTEPLPLKPGENARGWFYYEWGDKYAANKASTEDGTATRDMAQIGIIKLGYNPVHCNWDAWAGHWKPYCVPKPNPVRTESLTEKFAAAVQEQISRGTEYRLYGDSQNIPLEDGPMSADIEAAKSRTRLLNAQNGLRDFGSYEITLDYPGQGSDWALVGNSSDADKEVMKGLAGGKTIAEVGSFIGKTAKLMVEAGARLVYCVDHFAGSESDMTADIDPSLVRRGFIVNCQQQLTDGTIRLIEMPSLAAAKSFDDGSLDMVFIDANHDYEAVKADIQAWLPKVKSGGIMCGHDYGNVEAFLGHEAFPGVRQAVDEAFGAKVRKPISGSSVWWIQVE